MGRTTARAATLGLAVASVLGTPSTGSAFTDYTAVTDGCHERITLEALDRAGWPGGATPPEPTELERRVAEDLTFPLDPARRDPWTVAFLLGARLPDVADFEPTDFVALAALAADPSTQDVHCLRSASDDNPTGNTSALAACRARIREEVELAIGPGDAIDLDATETFEVWLTFRHDIELPFPRFAFRLGLALHTLQDAFSHEFRDPEDGRVTSVLNYVDPLHRGYDEARDGHEHERGLDECTGGPDSRLRRVGWAGDASAELLVAVFSDASSREERLARVDAVLDRWLAYSPGCNESNDYCGAPELDEQVNGCAVVRGAGADPASPSLLFATVFAVVLAIGRVARARRFAAALSLALVLASSDTARAQSDERVRELQRDPTVEVLGVDPERDEATVVEVEERELTGGTPIERGPGFAVSGFGGIDDAVLGFGLGPRFDYVPWFIFGADVEYSSWISLATGEIAAGVVNAAFVADFIYGKFRSVELRGHLALGCSVLLFDLPNADRGTTGLFGGGSALGVAIRATRKLRVILDPAGIYVSVPQVRGVPLVHWHHRIMVTLQVTP